MTKRGPDIGEQFAFLFMSVLICSGIVCIGAMIYAYFKGG